MKPATPSCPPRRSTRLTSFAVLTATLFPLAASAVGFGEITVHSRIGENLLAEVALIGGKELADAGCYTLVAPPGAELPVITQARLRLIHSNDNYRLLIIGSKPVSEPVFAIRLRAACGRDLQHDYVLMPEAPLPSAESVANTTWQPATGQHLPDATATGVPGAKRAARPAPLLRPMPEGAAARPERPSRNARRAMPAPDREVAGDRLVLGPPREVSAGETPRGNSSDIETRLLRMETSLHSLNREMEALSASLTLSSEMLAARHELQMARTLQSPAVTASLPAPGERPAGNASAGNWLELILGTLLGGSLTAGLAAWLGRRTQRASGHS